MRDYWVYVPAQCKADKPACVMVFQDGGGFVNETEVLRTSTRLPTSVAWRSDTPSQLDPTIRTSIGLPNFPAYTSGHSTFSAAAAEVLSYLFPSAAASLEADKEEAGISRLYAAIHYRSDIEVGKAHGKRIGGYPVRFARQDGADQ